MGRGDTKSARGKIFKGSYGKWRPRKKNKNGPKSSTPKRGASSRGR